MDYSEFLKSKIMTFDEVGFDVKDKEINDICFPWQKDIIKWAAKLGRACIFSYTGTGKTIMQLEWARLISSRGKCKVLIVAPLAVSHQTQREASEKLSFKISNLRAGDSPDGIDIINYEQLANVDISRYGAVVLDESSILKNYLGKTKNEIIDMFRDFKYKLACTATPSPNDYIELGNHCEFMSVLSRNEMLSMYFVHDSGDTAQWRLKGHAENEYWRFVASWAAVFTKPSDMGYSDDGFKLPPLNYYPIVTNGGELTEGHLFPINANTMQERREARKNSVSDRVSAAADIVNRSKDRFIVWCNFNYENDLLKEKIKDSVAVKGDDSLEHKEGSLVDFSLGKIKCLISKPQIAGFGMNFQACNNEIFVGLSDSFEQYFQAVRRCWRFGQKKPVNVYVIYSETEGSVIENIKRKEENAEKMIAGMVNHTRKYVMENIKIHHQYRRKNIHDKKMIIPEWLHENN